MRIIFAGTSEFAVPILERLVKAREKEIVAVITQPDRRQGRGLKESSSPVKELALKYNLLLYQPVSINDLVFQPVLEKMNADLAVVAAYGQKLSARILSIPKYGWINIHPSLLPKYRGAAPVNYALWKGDTETGVTIFRIEEKMDAGPVIIQRRVSINEEETAVELEDKLARIGAELLVETLQNFEHNKPGFISQDEAGVSYAPRLKKEDGLIKWTDSAERIRNLIRAMQPWPGAYTFYQSPKQGVLKIDITKAKSPACGGVNGAKDGAEGGVAGAMATKAPLQEQTPGMVIDLSQEGIMVATGNGLIVIKELKPAGKKSIPAQAFINGYRIKKGDHFGTYG